MKRLRTRLAIASGLSAAIGGALAASVAGGTASELSRRHDDAWLLDATHELADEVDEELEDDDDDDIDESVGDRTLADALAHELADDVPIASARARIHTPSSSVGDDALPEAPREECEEIDLDGAPLRICTVPFDDGTLTLAVDDTRARARRGAFVWASLIGVIASAILGALASAAVARWALAPLAVLRARVRRVDPAAPEPAVLEPPVDYEEIESMRVALVDLVGRLREALAVARSFAADASHELRTPLATLLAELELLAESAPTEGDRQAQARARDRVRDLSALVERLLVLARPVRESELTDAVELEDVVASVVDALPEDARRRVVVRVAEGTLVRGDAALLVSLVGNAVDNALKFAEGDMRVTVARESESVVIDVEDDGPGIPAAERARVFEAFYRGARWRAEASPGHGVGLALIARIAANHGGTAELLPSERGAHLRVRLPAWSARASESA